MPKLTKQHYELIASIVKDLQYQPWCLDNMDDFEAMVTLIENHIGHLNPQYNSAKFRKACGLEQDENYRDLSDEELEKYHLSLNAFAVTNDHLIEVEKEIDERELRKC